MQTVSAQFGIAGFNKTGFNFKVFIKKNFYNQRDILIRSFDLKFWAGGAVGGEEFGWQTPRNTGRKQQQRRTKIRDEILGTDWEQNRQKNHKKRKISVKNFST